MNTIKKLMKNRWSILVVVFGAAAILSNSIFIFSKSVIFLTLFYTASLLMYLLLIAKTYLGFVVWAFAMVHLALLFSTGEMTREATVLLISAIVFSFVGGLSVHIGVLRQRSMYINWGIGLILMTLSVGVLLGLSAGLPFL